MMQFFVVYRVSDWEPYLQYGQCEYAAPPTSGNTSRTFTLRVTPETTIGEVKRLVQGQSGVDADQIRLIRGALQYDDRQTLRECGLGREDCLRWVPRIGCV
jgi:hypothetical protein